MKLVWTRSSSPLSKLIRWITGEDCSHFAVILYEKSVGPIVFQSNLLGTHPAFRDTFLKGCAVVHEMQVDLEQADEDQIMDGIIKNFDGKGYDFKGALYLGLCILKQRFFGTKRPQVNRWAKPDQFFCDEVYDIFKHIDKLPKIDVTGGMHTPHDVWEELKEKFQ